jgi:hypothetical protein
MSPQLAVQAYMITAIFSESAVLSRALSPSRSRFFGHSSSTNALARFTRLLPLP